MNAIRYLLLLCLASAGMSVAQTPDYYASTVGTCPPHGRDDPEFVLPRSPSTKPATGYFFVGAHAQGTRPDWPVELSMYRTVCGNGQVALWLTMKDIVSGGRYTPLPKISVVQDGVTKGWFGLDCTYRDQHRSCPKSPGPFFWRPVVDGVLSSEPGAWANGTDNLRADASFSPERAFTLRIRDTDSWPNDAPDLVYEIPAMDVQGNLNDVSNTIAGQWWSPSDPGWGLVLDRNTRGTVYAAWLTFDAQGQTTWFVMTFSSTDPAGGVSGDVHQPTGPSYSSATLGQSFQPGPVVGRFRLEFSSATKGTFHLNVNGVSRSHPIERIQLRSRDGHCGTGFPAGAFLVKEQLGWGLAMDSRAACGNHFSFLTYDESGLPIWLFGGLEPKLNFLCAQDWCSPNYLGFEGRLYRPRGRAYFLAGGGQPFVQGSPVGKAELLTEAREFTYQIGSIKRTVKYEKFFFEF